MGMAASQARYLALTARKTNTEWEGQQINQARTALANQTANYFNRLLNMKVPDAPDPTDYTTVQYSYKDGSSGAVIDNWKQLSTADPEYNYVVDNWYYADIYTGMQKLLTNPEVTIKHGAVVNKTLPSSIAKENNEKYYEVKDANGNITTYTRLKDFTRDKDLENAIKDLDEKGFIDLGIPKTIKTENVTFVEKDASGQEIRYQSDLYGYKDTNNVWHFDSKKNLEDSYQSQFVPNPTPEDPNHKDIVAPTIDVNDYFSTYDPQYVGNCKLTKLTEYSIDEQTELEQIVKDLHDSDFAKVVFTTDEEGNKTATGQIYKFQMNGLNYYSCYSDLINSMTTYDEYGKPIESQEKLPYYRASYINQKITETTKALLETDGEGRFVTARFEDDSVKYSLNVETVTDEARYQDAMNKYYHEVQKYEQTIAEINAKTEIIQIEDRTLELRLRQLDTEQKALATEMDAVKKVIKDNVESTFKTFGE